MPIIYLKNTSINNKGLAKRKRLYQAKIIVIYNYDK